MAKTAEIAEVSLTDLHPYERNAKIHDAAQVEKIAESIKEFGFVSPCLIDRQGNIIAGHGRVEAAKRLGLTKVPCVYIEGLTDTQRRAYILADNRLTELGGWNEDILQWELSTLEAEGIEVELVGFEPFKRQTAPVISKEEAHETLAERFVVPPFSVLDSRQAWWQDRKRAWRAYGINSAEGRGNDGDPTENGLTYSKSHMPPGTYKSKNRIEEALGREITWSEFYDNFPQYATFSHTSIFDPVLCEIAYRWFTRKGDRVLDPFAGGSVRGIVGALLGRKYTGVDLSERQINANLQNWAEIPHAQITDGDQAPAPSWIVGDSLNLAELVKENNFDFLFTCPPYADLEVYSDDPRDISNMEYKTFCTTYAAIIFHSVQKLKKNAFAFVVVGDIRDKQGNLRDFVSFTIKAFREAGMALYNEGILVTQNGSIATTASKPFKGSRKVSKHHQNVLIFTDARDRLRIIENTAEEIEGAVREAGLAENHIKVLTFLKGDAKERAEELGDIDTALIDSFTVDI